MIEYRRLEQLERDDIARQALEAAAKRLESYSANPLYKKALKVGAKLIREMKPI